MSDPTVTVSVDRRAGATAAAAPQLVRLVQADRPLERSARHVLSGVRAVAIGRGGEAGARRGTAGGMPRLELRVPDKAMSNDHAALLWVQGGWVLEDRG